MKLRRFWLLTGGIALAMLLLFLVFEATGLGAALALPEPRPESRMAFGALGVALLVADVLLPVPSSVVMLGHGALFGVALGTALSALGATLATIAGHTLGRAGAKTLGRLMTEDELRRAHALIERWGLTAIVLSRPIPILAETVAIVAGASGFPVGTAAFAGLLGALPAAAMYAWAGSRRLDAASDAAIFGLVSLLSAGAWIFGKKKR